MCPSLDKVSVSTLAIIFMKHSWTFVNNKYAYSKLIIIM